MLKQVGLFSPFYDTAIYKYLLNKLQNQSGIILGLPSIGINDKVAKTYNVIIMHYKAQNNDWGVIRYCYTRAIQMPEIHFIVFVDLPGTVRMELNTDVPENLHEFTVGMIGTKKFLRLLPEYLK